MLRNLIALAMAATIYGCSSTHGTPITQDKVDSLVVGQTSMQDAVHTFGPPIAETTNSDGTKVLSWGYAKAGLGSSTQSQGLSIVFDRDGKVMSFSRSDYGQLH